MSGADELKPCPFCGGEAEVESPTCGYRVQCVKAGCHAAGPWPDDCTEIEAITTWNVRRPTTTQPDRERVLREAAAIARKARETTYAGGNISQGYIAAAGDIERQILALLAQAPEQSDTQSDAVRDGPEITYEVWEDDFLVASSSSLTDAGHYLAVCSQDADFRLVKAETYRTPIRNEAADTGVNARSIVGEGE